MRFTFTPDLALNIDFSAGSDQDTVVNLTNHCYFDLSGGKNPLGQLLWIDADQFTENDENTLPTGVIADVAGTPFDFRQPKPLVQDITADSQQLRNCSGYDHNFVLKNGGKPKVIARLSSPDTGIILEETTDLPGVQLYPATLWTPPTGSGPMASVPAFAWRGSSSPMPWQWRNFRSPFCGRAMNTGT